MTDRDRLRALLADFGVFFVESDREEWWPGRTADPPWPRPAEPNITPAAITIPAGDFGPPGPKNTGYGGFYCAFKFEDDGTFIEVEVAE